MRKEAVVRCLLCGHLYRMKETRDTIVSALNKLNKLTKKVTVVTNKET